MLGDGIQDRMAAGGGFGFCLFVWGLGLRAERRRRRRCLVVAEGNFFFFRGGVWGWVEGGCIVFDIAVSLGLACRKGCWGWVYGIDEKGAKYGDTASGIVYLQELASRRLAKIALMPSLYTHIPMLMGIGLRFPLLSYRASIKSLARIARKRLRLRERYRTRGN